MRSDALVSRLTAHRVAGSTMIYNDAESFVAAQDSNKIRAAYVFPEAIMILCWELIVDNQDVELLFVLTCIYNLLFISCTTIVVEGCVQVQEEKQT